MARLQTTTRSADASTNTSQTVPGWRALLEQIDQKDERIDELEREVERLRDEIERLRADAPSGEDAGSSKAAELVDALRQTADSSE